MLHLLALGSLLCAIACSRQPAALQVVHEQDIDGLQLNVPVPVSPELESGPDYLFEIRGHEVDLEVRVVEAPDRASRALRVANTRLPPLFLVLDGDDIEAGANLQLVPRNLTRNAKVRVRVYQLPDSDRASRLLTEAYERYARATETGELTDQNYQAPLADLHTAAEQFRATGRREEALWADAVAARIMVWPALQFGPALELVNRTLEQARELGLKRVELMLSDQQGVLLTEICGSNPYPNLLEAREAALARFGRAGELADELGMDYERAWARNNSGIANYYLGRAEAAIGHYEQALRGAQELGDPWLQGVVNGNRSLAQDLGGNVSNLAEGLEHWQQEVARLRAARDQERLPHALILLGRAYLRLHLFPQSIAALSEALDADAGISQLHDSSRARLWLAYAYHSIGDLDRAAPQFASAIRMLEEANDCRSLLSAHRWMADLERERGRFESMAAHRAEQSRYSISVLDRARYHVARAEDLMALEAGESKPALAEYRQAMQLLESSADENLRLLTRLKMCGLDRRLGHTGEGCATEQLRADFESLRRQGGPRSLIEGMQAWGEILVSSGDTEAAIAHFEEMIGEIRMYRQRLPGVLGSWYWERRGALFSQYLDLLIKRDQATGAGSRSLAALDALMNFELKNQRSANNPEAEPRLRNLVLTLDAQRDPVAVESTRREIELLLSDVSVSRGEPERVSQDWLISAASSMRPDTAAVAFHFAPGAAWRWWISEQGIVLDQLAASEDLEASIRIAKSQLRTVGYSGLNAELDFLGTSLLGDISERVPGRLFLLGGAALNGFPFDAIRLGGRYLGAGATVVNVQSLSTSGELATAPSKPGAFSRVFAAGASDWRSLSMPDLPMVGEELDLVAASLGGSEVFRAEGRAFTQASFKTTEFLDADLVHLASHAETNLDYPELSRFYFGDASGAQDHLTPFGLNGLDLGARLVVLSACDTSGSNRFTFDSNLGFVSAFLANGAESVMATLWPIPDRHGLEFMRLFYGGLARGEGVIEAFGQAKQEMFTAPDGRGSERGFAYQLYLR